MEDLTRRDAVKLAAAGTAALGASVAWAAGSAEAKQQPDEARGSTKLLEDVLVQKPVVDRGELRQMVATAMEKHNARLIWWWWKGQPAIDAVLGRLEVEPKALGEVVRSLFATKLLPTLRVFPRGIPRPEDFVVQFEIGEIRS